MRDLGCESVIENLPFAFVSMPRADHARVETIVSFVLRNIKQLRQKTQRGIAPFPEPSEIVNAYESIPYNGAKEG